MTTLSSRRGLNSDYGQLIDTELEAGGIAVDQDEYTAGLDRTYDVRGLANMHVEITNTGATENGLTYRIDKSRNNYVSLTELTDLDFDAEIKTDTIVAAGTLADGTITTLGVQENVFANSTVTVANPVGIVSATGTITLTAVAATDTVTINGLIYLAVSGSPVEGEFDIDGGTDALDAVALEGAINSDTRTGTTGDLSAGVPAGNVLTVTTDVVGLAGNAITFTSQDASLAISGSGTLTGGNEDIVTINGLTYTAVTGPKADNTEFTVDNDDENSTIDLALSIGNDSRTGTLGDVTTTRVTNVLTIITDVAGTAGNAVTLTSTDGTTLAVTGSGFLAGGLNVDTVTVNGLLYTAIDGSKAGDFTKFDVTSSDIDSAVDLADSITNDVRVGTLGDVKATSATNVVTCESTQTGEAFNAITLVSSDGTTLAVTGSGFFANGTEPADSITAIIDVSPESTAIRIRVKRETSAQDTIFKGIVSIN